ncbi:MAG TPA: ROK family protein [Vicinamibacteria bacterium]
MSSRGGAVGIDIGGTKIAVAAVDESGDVVGEATIPTEPERGFASGVSRIAAIVTRLLEDSGGGARRLDGIGIGCAGPVDRIRGTILNPHTLPGWKGGDIVTPLRDAFGCPVRLENDADMALLGECHAGAGRGFDPVVMLTFGTGIGGAALVRGELLRGAAGEHPDMGHVPVDPRGPRCYCGSNGCFESLASGSALAEAAAAHGLGDGRQLFARAARHDPVAEGILRDALSAMSSATWTIVHALLPERLILGGGMMDEHYETFAAAAREAIARATLAPRERLSVARAALGNRAGVLGAASAVRDRQGRD